MIDVVLNPHLIPQYGIVGAAVATVVGYVVYNGIEVAAIFRTVGSHTFSTNSLKPLVPTILFAVGLARLTSGTDRTLPILLGIGAIVSVVHLLLTVLTRSLDHADLFLFK